MRAKLVSPKSPLTCLTVLTEPLVSLAAFAAFWFGGAALMSRLSVSFESPPFLVPWASVSSCTEKQLLATRKVTFSFVGTNREVTLAGPLGQAAKVACQASTES